MLTFGPFQLSKYLLFCTEKYIGLQYMPPDGNPFKHVAMIGHPNEVIIFSILVR